MTHAILRFDSDETVRFCERFGIDPKRCTGFKIEVAAPGLVGYITFDMHLEPGDLDAIGGKIDTRKVAEFS